MDTKRKSKSISVNYKNPGFTLIELLVVISVISLLSSTVLVTANQYRARARDATRIQNLLQVKKALELYYSDNNSYPVTSNFYTEYNNPNTYIPNFEKYMARLPRDPMAKFNSEETCYGVNGYMYNSNGKDYKFLAYCTVEQYPGLVPSNNQFYDPYHPVRTFGVHTPGGIAW